MPRKIIKRPAFQMYPADWLASTKISLMTIAQEGGYHRLLMHCWMDADCSLPDDDDQLAVLSRLGDEWESSSRLIRSCFQIHPKLVQRLTNIRLLSERKKQDKWHRKSVDGGLKSAEARLKKGKGGSPLVGTNGATKPEPTPQPNANSSDFSLHSTVNIKTRSLPVGDPTPFPFGWNDHWTLRNWWDTFEYRARLEEPADRESVEMSLHWQQKLEGEVKDAVVWLETLEFWDGNGYRVASVQKQINKYREFLNDKQQGKAKQNGSTEQQRSSNGSPGRIASALAQHDYSVFARPGTGEDDR